MKLSNPAIATVIGGLTSIVVFFILLSLKALEMNAIVVSSLLAFAATFVITYGTLEFLVFREINRMKDILHRINKDPEEEDADADLIGNAKLKEGLLKYHKKREKEIEKLRKLAAFRKEFIADVSHELKTPIFAAQGFVHTLLDGAIEDKSVRDKFLKKAARSLDGLDVLVQDLVTLSQMEIGEIRMHYEYFDVYHLVEDVVEQFESRAQKKDISIDIAPEKKKSMLVYADPQRIFQVLLNLTSNAINYTDEGGSIKLEVRMKKTEVEVMVTDSGIGIPKEDLDKVFQRFYRVDKSRSRKQGGTGLGLAIVKHIIELHKSNIKVKSKVDKGTTFSFKLPKGKPEPLFQGI